MSAHPFQNFMVRFAKEDQIFAEGEPGTTMYIVQSGAVQLYRTVEGDKRPICTLEKGDFFGEMTILEGMPRTQSAEAASECELIEINSTIFDKMIRSNIEIAVRMLRKLSLRLRETERRLSEVDVEAGTTGAAPVASVKATRSAIETGVRLELGDGDGAYSIADEEILIGRYDPVTEQRPDIDLTDIDLKRTVSRRHARIVRTDQGHMVIEEVGALNGTFVNDQRLTAGQGHPLQDGDRLSVGSVALVYRD